MLTTYVYPDRKALIAKARQSGTLLIACDLWDPDCPVRLMTFVAEEGNPCVIVRRVGLRPGFLERIELFEEDAEQRLARYAISQVYNR